MRHIFVLALSLVLLTLSSACSMDDELAPPKPKPDPEPNPKQTISTWDKTFGGSKDDEAYSLIQTADGGYAMVGHTNSKGAGEIDFWLVKVDKEGKKQWDKTFGERNYDRAYSVVQTSDGGYAITGHIGSTESKGAGSTDFWLVKVDSKGNKQWDKTFGGSKRDEASSIIQTSDGGYVLAGATTSKGAGSFDLWIVKVDQGGNLIWDKTFGGSEWDSIQSLIQTTDGGYVMAGIATSKGADGSYNSDFWLVKVNQDGNLIWNKTFGGSKWEQAESLIQTTDGGYALVGSTYSKGAGYADFWLVKVDSKGDWQWDKTYGGGGWEFATSLIQTTDGGYAVAGVTNSKGVGDNDFWLVKVDEGGNLIWDKTFGGLPYDGAQSLIQTKDRGYVMTGYTQSKGAGGYDFWLVKVDPNGNLNKRK